MNASTVLATQEHAKTRVGATNAHVHQNGREAIARVSHKIKYFFCLDTHAQLRAMLQVLASSGSRQCF